jgi:hypothetical protein
LSIFEPPRFFEALLRGRKFGEVLDIVARICGICPIAYQMSGVHAIEHALGIEVDAPIRALGRLFYCGEWIESHALHIVMLHAPDFLGYPDAIAMARDHGEAVERALALKKAGNALLRLLGGREIHPINAARLHQSQLLCSIEGAVASSRPNSNQDCSGGPGQGSPEATGVSRRAASLRRTDAAVTLVQGGTLA